MVTCTDMCTHTQVCYKGKRALERQINSRGQLLTLGIQGSSVQRGLIGPWGRRYPMNGVLRTRAPASLPQRLCRKLQAYYLGRYLGVVFNLLILKSLSGSFPGTLNPTAHVMPDPEDLRALWLTPGSCYSDVSSPSRDGPARLVTSDCSPLS